MNDCWFLSFISLIISVKIYCEFSSAIFNELKLNINPSHILINSFNSIFNSAISLLIPGKSISSIFSLNLKGSNPSIGIYNV